MGVIKKRLLFLPLIALLLTACSPLTHESTSNSASADYAAANAARYRGDFKAALKEFKRLALKGDAHSQTMLGVMYGMGQGVPQDYAQAAKWYRKSALQGDAYAQTSLGYMYQLGQGVAQDYVRSHMWFNICAAELAKRAFSGPKSLCSKARDAVAKGMTPSQLAEAQKLAREWKPKKE